MRRSAIYVLQFSVLVLSFVTVVLSALGTPAGQRIDQAAMVSISEAASGTLGSWLETVVASTPPVAIGAAALSVLWACVRRRYTTAAAVAVMFGGSVATSQVMKNVFVSRPDLLSDAAWYSNSLPSGHATLAIAGACAVACMAPDRGRSATTLFSAALAVCVAVGVVVSAWHRPSDVVAGALVVGGWGLLTSAGEEVFQALTNGLQTDGIGRNRGAVWSVGLATSGLGLAGLYAVGVSSAAISIALICAAVLCTVSAAATRGDAGRGRLSRPVHSLSNGA